MHFLSHCLSVNYKVETTKKAKQVSNSGFIANALAPKIRGWINYYGKFRLSELQPLFRALNKRIARWIRNKYRLKTYGKSYGLMKRIIASYPNTFVHWEYGYKS